jgi:hypothetical protein
MSRHDCSASTSYSTRNILKRNRKIAVANPSGFRLLPCRVPILGPFIAKFNRVGVRCLYVYSTSAKKILAFPVQTPPNVTSATRVLDESGAHVTYNLPPSVRSSPPGIAKSLAAILASVASSAMSAISISATLNVSGTHFERRCLSIWFWRILSSHFIASINFDWKPVSKSRKRRSTLSVKAPRTSVGSRGWNGVRTSSAFSLMVCMNHCTVRTTHVI